MKILAVANSKGGSGKTTNTFNIGCELHRLGLRVCLIDFDPQASLTHCFKIELPQTQVYIEDVVSKAGFGRLSIQQAIVEIKPGLSLIPSTGALGNIENDLRAIGGMLRLKQVLSTLSAEQFDIVLIDPPGSSDIFMTLTLLAAREILIPIRPTDTDLATLEDFIGFINEHQALNPDLRVRGILLNQVQGSSKNGQFYMDRLKSSGLGDLVLNSTIRTAIDAANSIAYGKPSSEYKPKSAVSQDFKNVAKEIASWL
jgi:chromosome partitioning protein